MPVKAVGRPDRRLPRAALKRLSLEAEDGEALARRRQGEALVERVESVPGSPSAAILAAASWNASAAPRS
jgi:hypothetical protein